MTVGLCSRSSWLTTIPPPLLQMMSPVQEGLYFLYSGGSGEALSILYVSGFVNIKLMPEVSTNASGKPFFFFLRFVFFVIFLFVY